MSEFSKPGDLIGRLPNPKFNYKCKTCGNMFIRLPPNGICPGCQESERRKQQELEKKDAIEPEQWWQK